MEALAVVAGLLFSDGKVLICQRPPDKKYEAGKWEFPGGKLEEGETPQQALKRELREELAIDVRVGRLRDARITHLGERAALILFYDCEADDAPKAVEHSRIEFALPEDLLSYDLADADLRAAETIFSDKEKTDA